MIIKRRFRFYAAHRNHMLQDKCARLHGHRYGVEVHLQVQPGSAAVGVLFAEIDAAIAPVFEELDHRTLAWRQDAVACAVPECVVLPCPTSAECLAALLLQRCHERLPQVVALELQETDSATVVAQLEDCAQWLTHTG